MIPNLHSVKRLNYLKGALPPEEDPVSKLSASSTQARSHLPQERDHPHPGKKIVLSGGGGGVCH